ncbi:MAG: hypothetical protein H0W81_12350 [Chloroflexi bacterium]|nr:hypothetical protein [Chloroflexota bacterium]
MSNPPNVTRLHLDGHRSCPARGQVLVMGDGPGERASGESLDSAELHDPGSGT